MYPPGYQFLPNKEQIFCCYLQPAINGDPIPSGIFIQAEIYGENREPWNIFNKDSRNSFWVFTKLKKKSKSRIDRTAGCGCWLGRNVTEVKHRNGQLLGFDKYFTFACKKDKSSRGNGHWIMHEFSLKDEALSDFVICEIKNKDAAVSSDQKDEGEAKNKKRKSDEASVPITKKVYTNHQRSLNESTGDEWNARSTSTCCQRSSWEIDHQENQDLNREQAVTMTSTSSPYFVDYVVHEDVSTPSIKKNCADHQRSLNVSDHQEDQDPERMQTTAMTSTSSPDFADYIGPENLSIPSMKKDCADHRRSLNEGNSDECKARSSLTCYQQNSQDPNKVQTMISSSSPGFADHNPPQGLTGEYKEPYVDVDALLNGFDIADVVSFLDQEI